MISTEGLMKNTWLHIPIYRTHTHTYTLHEVVYSSYQILSSRHTHQRPLPSLNATLCTSHNWTIVTHTHTHSNRTSATWSSSCYQLPAPKQSPRSHPFRPWTLVLPHHSYSPPSSEQSSTTC